jgi:hypothetical protein
MISVCTVLLNSKVECLKIWLESIRRKATIISEVLIADVNPTKKPEEILKLCRGLNARILPVKCVPLDGHAIGLHTCINNATNEIILISDNDVFHYMHGFDKFLLDTHDKYGLLLTGVCHWSHFQAFDHFPMVVTLLARKKDFPPKEFLSERLLLDRSGYKVGVGSRPGVKMHRGRSASGHWLLAGPVDGYWDKFPHPKWMFDVGSNLYTWVKESNGKWIAFSNEVHEGKIYYTKNFNNFKLNDDFGNQKILFHQTRGNRAKSYRAETKFQLAWKRFLASEAQK